jgi:CheY-like chemotaxis protein
VANILIVDDDPAVQITIRLTPESPGHVTAPSAGHRRLALLEAGQLDLPFPDIFMPGVDGLDTMRRIRQPDVRSGRG